MSKSNSYPKTRRSNCGRRKTGLRLLGGARCKCQHVEEVGKARERRTVQEVIAGQIDAGYALSEIAVDDDLGDLVDPAIWPKLIEEMKTWRKVEEDEFSPEPEPDF